MAAYNYLKLVHLIAVILFLGNIFTGLYWMRIAVKTKDLKIIHHSINGVIKSDRLFTIPGVIVITAGGFLTAIYGHIPILGTGWILWSIILFSVSGIVFGIKVAPLQKQLALLTDTEVNLDWDQFLKVFKQWEFWGLVALLTPIAAMIMMTLKVPA